MKSILDLCRELPASEPEIREREREFDEAVRLATEPETTDRQYIRSISDAKTATDAMIAREFKMYVEIAARCYACTLFRTKYGDWPDVFTTARASTEPLARAACALLAAEAMKGEK